MAKRGNDLRPNIKLRSTAGTGYTCATRKNRRNDPDRLVLRKYDPQIRQHVDFREDRRWPRSPRSSPTSAASRPSPGTPNAGPP
jgi:large subunit ribosomal protein L33